MSPFWSGVITVLVVFFAIWAGMFAYTAKRYRDEARDALLKTGVLLNDFQRKTLDPMTEELKEIRAIAAGEKVRPIK